MAITHCTFSVLEFVQQGGWVVSVWLIGLLVWIAPAAAVLLLLAYMAFRTRAEGKSQAGNLPEDMLEGEPDAVKAHLLQPAE